MSDDERMMALTGLYIGLFLGATGMAGLVLIVKALVA